MDRDETDELMGEVTGLPNSFEVTQARAFRDLLRDGRYEEAEKVRQHLVSEAATNSEEAALFQRTTINSAMLAESIRLRSEGDEEAADALMVLLQAIASKAEIETLLAALFLQIGQYQGWLPEDHYDLVSQHLSEDSPDRHNLIGAIARGKPAT